MILAAAFCFALPLNFAQAGPSQSASTACATSLAKIQHFASIKASAEFQQWRERTWQLEDMPESPFGISFGHSDIVSELHTQQLIEEGGFDNFQLWDAILIRTFLANQKSPGISIIPPHRWLRNQHLKAPKYRPTKAAAEMAELTLKTAEERGLQGPLFFFFLDDFKAHILSNPKIALTGEELAANERLLIERNGLKVEEGYTEAEFRILFRDPRLLERTQFFLNEQEIKTEDVFKLLGIKRSS